MMFILWIRKLICMRIRMTSLSIVLAILLTMGCKSSIQTVESETTNLFQSESAGWKTKGDAKWELSDGVLSAQDDLGYAIINRPYKNFVLEAEFLPDAVVNSGIFIRCPDVDFNPTKCYEINIADNHENQAFRTGAIVTHGKPLEVLHTVSKWNRYKIIANNNRIEVWLNGTKTADLEDATSSEGFIGFQLNGKGKIMFRNVRIKAI